MGGGASKTPKQEAPKENSSVQPTQQHADQTEPLGLPLGMRTNPRGHGEILTPPILRRRDIGVIGSAGAFSIPCRKTPKMR